MASPTIEDIRSDAAFPAYVACMRKILGELADWPAERVDESIECSLQNPGFRTLFMHDTPAYNAASLLVAERIGDRATGLDGVRLHHRIWQAIELQGDDYNVFPNEDPSYDWQAARQRVADIFSEYDHGASEGSSGKS